MKFKSLQENLRKTIQQRITAGELTGLRLAEQTGFRQAHISNFLNRKRSLSIPGMDRVLNVQRLSVLDLLDPEEVNKRSSILPPSDDEFENVVLVDAEIAAAQPLVMSMNVREIQKFKRSFCASCARICTANAGSGNASWRSERIVTAWACIRVFCQARLFCWIRHYNSLAPYRRGEMNVYAVQVNDACKLRYVEVSGHNLVLRPKSDVSGAGAAPRRRQNCSRYYIVGRVCYVGMEI